MTLAAREQASARAKRSSYERDRAHVLAVLARRCGWLDHGEREAALHDAYLVLLQKQHDGTIDVAAMNEYQVRAYLVQAAIHKALDEGKRAGRTRESSLDVEQHEAHDLADIAAAPHERAVSDQTSSQVREIVAELPQRQQTIVKLRFFFDRTPEEIQRFLGVSERAYRRELERAMRQLASGVELVREGQFCESRRSAILALVAGIAGPNRARDARDHLASCPACAHWAVTVRESTRDAAAVLPLPAVALAGPGGRLGRLLEGVREFVSGSASSTKQHATETATRLDAATAGYATAARPGALAAAVAGCLALGGGATYCVVEGVPAPLRALAGVERPTAPPRSADRGGSASASAPSLPSSPSSSRPSALRPPALPAAATRTPQERRRQQARDARRRARRLAERRRAARQRAARQRAARQRATSRRGSGSATERRQRPGPATGGEQRSAPEPSPAAPPPPAATGSDEAAAREFGAEGSGVPVTPAPAPAPAPEPRPPASPPPAATGGEFGP